jgi:hypothetical protein
MGLYVWVPKICCGEELQFQSKSHPTEEWGEVDLDSVPLEVARDITGDTQECPHCLRIWRIRTATHIFNTVPMEIRCENEDEVGQRESESDEDEGESTEDRLKAIERQLGLRK